MSDRLHKTEARGYLIIRRVVEDSENADDWKEKVSSDTDVFPEIDAQRLIKL